MSILKINNDKFPLVSEIGDLYNVEVDEYGTLITDEYEDLRTSNTYDPEKITEALSNIRYKSFNNLMNLQNQLCNVKRFDINYTDLKPYKRTYGITTMDDKFYFSVNVQFILTEKRKEFNDNGYYRELTVDDISGDDRIFHYIPKIFINGLVIDNFKVRCLEDKTFFIFTYGESFEEEFMKEMEENNYPITVVLLPKTNKVVGKKFNVLTFNMQAIDILYECKNTIRNGTDIFTLEGPKDYFQLPLQSYPIPANHILPFATKSGFYKFLHQVDIEMHYPNVYKLLNVPDDVDVELMVFYNEGTVLEDFKNDLDLYFKHRDILRLYNTDTVPSYIKEYSPKYVEYDIENYRNSNHMGDVETYKLKKLQEFVDNDSNVLEDYLKLTSNPSSYYLDISGIDLSKRYRLDTFKDLETLSSRIVFDSPKYLFVFSKDSLVMKRHYNFYIDGVYNSCEYIFSEGEYDYIYIDADRVSADSVIEIEMYYNMSFDVPVYIENIHIPYKIDLGLSQTTVHANDIYLTDDLGNKIDSGSFRLYTRRGVDLPTRFNSNAVLEDGVFCISCVDADLIGKTVHVRIKKGLTTYKLEDDEIQSGLIVTNKVSFLDNQAIHVYVNDRLIPPNMVEIDFSKNLNLPSTILIPIIIQPTDIINIQIVPYRLEVVMNADKANNSLIDSYGILDKPMNLRWYDVFVNGVKLNKQMLEVVTPTKSIVSGTKSLKNICIIQNHRDVECVKISEKNITDVIWDSEADIRISYLKDIEEQENSII